MTEHFFYKSDLPDNINFTGSVAIDTETMGLKKNRDRLCLVQIADMFGNVYLIQFESGKYSAPNLKKLLQNNKILKIFHFARFDMAILKYSLKTKINNIYCTKIASKLARTYSDSHSLKSLVYEFAAVELSKKQQSSDWGSEIFSKEQIKYAASDVLYLHKIKEKLDAILIREGREKFAKKCFDFLPTLIDLDLSGFEEIDIFSHQ